MNKRTIRKFLFALSSMLLLVTLSVGITLAYLTDTDTVTNTFSVGKVYITLDEADVDDSTADKDRDQANAYHLVPGQQYDKDPIVHVEAGSEDCWVFVKVDNGLADIEDKASYKVNDTDTTAASGKIAEQIEKFGWTELTGVDNVYYKEHKKSDAVTDYVVFKNFKIIGDNLINGAKPAQPVEGKFYISEFEDAAINVKAYAIQRAGFDTAAAAWGEVAKLDDVQ